MKQYLAPEFVKIDFLTEDVLGDSIIDAGVTDDDKFVEIGPIVDIFGKN